MTKLIRYNGSNGRSALYVDGKLQIYAGWGAVEEVIAEIRAEHPGEDIEIRDTNSDDHLRGANQRDNIAMTIAELDEWVRQQGLQNTEQQERAIHASRASGPELIHYAAGTEGPHALYVDTALEAFGGMEEIAERVMQIAGVKLVRSTDFLLGGHRYEHAARTTDQIDEYRKAREAEEARTTTEQRRQRALDRAGELRAQAELLNREADKLVAEARR